MTSVLNDASPPAILEALDQHEREVSATYARLRGGIVEDGPEVLLYATGLPAQWANGAKRPRLDRASADAAIERSRRMLDEAGVPGTWVVGPLATPADIGERLGRAGFERQFDLRMMAAPIEALELDGPEPPALRIRRVDSEEAHVEWLRVMTDGFGMQPEHTRTVDETARAVGFDGDAPWVRFVGTVDGPAVASAGLMTFGGLAGIYNVATVPDARRRGYGAAMTRAALRAARDRGYRVAILGASDPGRGIYERMGFREVAMVRQLVYRPRGA
ncbi:MAG: GNAT family N-acetyltransferase [Actinomycetota bacterium]